MHPIDNILEIYFPKNWNLSAYYLIRNCVLMIIFLKNGETEGDGYVKKD